MAVTRWISALSRLMNRTIDYPRLAVFAVAGCVLTMALVRLGGTASSVEALPGVQVTRTGPSRVPGANDLPLPTMGEGVVVGGRDVQLPQTGRVQVMVELGDPPAARVYAAAKQAGLPDSSANALAQLQTNHIEAAQQALLSILTGPEFQATIVGRVQRVLNGIAIEVDVSKLERIRQLPGVIALRRLRIGQLDGAPAPGPARPGRDSGPSLPVEPRGQLQ